MCGSAAYSQLAVVFNSNEVANFWGFCIQKAQQFLPLSRTLASFPLFPSVQILLHALRFLSNHIVPIRLTLL